MLLSSLILCGLSWLGLGRDKLQRGAPAPLVADIEGCHKSAPEARGPRDSAQWLRRLPKIKQRAVKLISSITERGAPAPHVADIEGCSTARQRRAVRGIVLSSCAGYQKLSSAQ
jgi:hypothetical protein